MKWIDVACAVIVSDKKLLACQRGVNTDHPFEWEFPGGKVETGETAVECVVREISEELGVDVMVLQKLEAIAYNYGFKAIRLIPFLCEIRKGQPKALEHVNIKWQSFHEFENLKWSEADRKLFYINQKNII